MPDLALLTTVNKLTRDLRDASVTLSTDEARFLVDAYYMMQDDRIRSAAQARQLQKSGEPHSVLNWLYTQHETLELQIKRALDAYSDSILLGRWARSIVGIGPVITAGLLAHIDLEHQEIDPITQLPRRVGPAGVWRFAGLDPTVTWGKGQKRPWNAKLKRLCWLIGESFTKTCNHPNAYYGRIYSRRKEYETAKNLAGEYAAQAALSLETKNFGADTQARKHYEAGHLPPARIHLRAQRYAVKRFLGDYWEVGFRIAFPDREPPPPYAIGVLGHMDYEPPPNWPMKE
jgi:hypothetical protein